MSGTSGGKNVVDVHSPNQSRKHRNPIFQNQQIEARSASVDLDLFRVHVAAIPAIFEDEGAAFAAEVSKLCARLVIDIGYDCAWSIGSASFEQHALSRKIF